MNKAMLIGHMGAKAETRTVGTTTVTGWTMATKKKWTDKEGKPQEKVEWFRCKWWGKGGENLAKWTDKGSHIFVEGEITTNEWTDKEGKKNYTTEILVNNVQFLGPKPTTPMTTNTENNWSAASTVTKPVTNTEPKIQEEIPW